jgi:hypothetical protein
LPPYSNKKEIGFQRFKSKGKSFVRIQFETVAKRNMNRDWLAKESLELVRKADISFVENAEIPFSLGHSEVNALSSSHCITSGSIRLRVAGMSFAGRKPCQFPHGPSASQADIRPCSRLIHQLYGPKFLKEFREKPPLDP